MVDSELRKLKKQIAKARTEIAKREELAKTKAERRKLQSELSLLKSPTKRTAIQLAKRLGRGFKFISVKTGKAIREQAILIKEQQEREKKRTKKADKFTRSKGITKETTSKTRQIFVPGIGVVTQQVKGKKVKRRKKKKSQPKQESQGDFFTGLSGFE
ncbi:MAG: hypothetical protein ACTSQA_01490 [Candidatus Heimdallarchaeaceae archaeon]